MAAGDNLPNIDRFRMLLPKQPDNTRNAATAAMTLLSDAARLKSQGNLEGARVARDRAVGEMAKLTAFLNNPDVAAMHALLTEWLAYASTGITGGPTPAGTSVTPAKEKNITKILIFLAIGATTLYLLKQRGII